MWRDLIRHNLGWKIGALLLATVIWLAIHRNIDRTELQIATRRYGPLPIGVLAQAGRTQAFEVKPPAVTVTVSGPSEVIEQMSAKDFAVFVNVAGEENTEETMRGVEVTTVKGIDILRVDPFYVRVRGLPPASPKIDQ